MSKPCSGVKVISSVIAIPAWRVKQVKIIKSIINLLNNTPKLGSYGPHSSAKLNEYYLHQEAAVSHDPTHTL